MIDFPITELLSETECVAWLATYLHPEGLVCPHCGSVERRHFREQGYFPAYRCLACDGYYTLLSGTVFEKTRQRPATLVLLLRGIAKGESSARLSRELGIGRKRVMVLRQRIQNNLYETLPTEVMSGRTFEADELYQNAGEKRQAASRPERPTARSATGSSSTRTRLARDALSVPAFRRAARSCSRMNRPTILACTLTTARSAILCMNGRVTMMATASAKSTVTPVKALALLCEPICAFFVVSINTTSPSMWRPLRPCSMPKPSHPLWSSACALVNVCTLETHEP